MSRFRVGETTSVFGGYVIEERTWYGWDVWNYYDWEEDAIADAEELEEKGHDVEWYI